MSPFKMPFKICYFIGTFFRGLIEVKKEKKGPLMNPLRKIESISVVNTMCLLKMFFTTHLHFAAPLY